jgi:hypothetical protein
VERLIEHSLAHAAHLLSQPVVNAVWCHVANARVPVHGVVPKEEGLAVGPSVPNCHEAVVGWGARRWAEWRL